MAEFKKKGRKNYKNKDRTETTPRKIDIAKNILKWIKSQEKLDANKTKQKNYFERLERYL